MANITGGRRHRRLVAMWQSQVFFEIRSDLLHTQRRSVVADNLGSPHRFDLVVDR
ncbi:hypothetical protein TIFTF001_016417 [Ficus carica]|uniref:Uncharacterized protein n=1 Tax=Ficus carica TaxID=3494 RepID=A0AA88D660_FICCA|nr:hypothetical protein TIFTF001_016417 [Ficus carica]